MTSPASPSDRFRRPHVATEDLPPPLLVIRPEPRRDHPLPRSFIVHLDLTGQPPTDPSQLPIYRGLVVPVLQNYIPKFARSVRECVASWTPITLRKPGISTQTELGGPNAYSAGISPISLSPAPNNQTTNVLDNEDCGKWLMENFPDGIQVDLDEFMLVRLSNELDALLSPLAFKSIDEAVLPPDILDFLAAFNAQRSAHVPAHQTEELFYELDQMGALRVTALALVNMFLRFPGAFKEGTTPNGIIWAPIRQEKTWGLTDSCTYALETSSGKRPISNDSTSATPKKRSWTEGEQSRNLHPTLPVGSSSPRFDDVAHPELVGALLEYKRAWALTDADMKEGVEMLRKNNGRSVLIRIEKKGMAKGYDFRLFNMVNGRETELYEKKATVTKIVHAWIQVFVQHHKYRKADAVLFNWYSSICSRLVAKNRLDISTVVEKDAAHYGTLTSFGLLVVLAARKQRPPKDEMFCDIERRDLQLAAFEPSYTTTVPDQQSHSERKSVIGAITLDIEELDFHQTFAPAHGESELEWVKDDSPGQASRVWVNAFVSQGCTWSCYKGGLVMPEGRLSTPELSLGPSIRLHKPQPTATPQIPPMTSTQPMEHPCSPEESPRRIRKISGLSSTSTDMSHVAKPGIAIAVKVCDRNPSRVQPDENRHDAQDALRAARLEAGVYATLPAGAKSLVPRFYGMWEARDDDGYTVCVMLLERLKRPLSQDEADWTRLTEKQTDRVIELVREFHDRTNMTHGDLRLRHIFCNDPNDLSTYRLIDLDRAKSASKKERKREMDALLRKLR